MNKTQFHKCPLCEGDNFNSQMLGEYPYYLCKDCGLGSVPEFGTEDDYLKNYYEGYHSNEERLNELRKGQYKIDSDHLLSYQKGGKLLDVGCSTGQFSKILNEKGNFELITAIDVDANALRTANSNNSSDTLKFLETDILNLNSSNQYDGILFRGVFQYMGDELNQILEKIKKILKPDGYIFIYSLPHSDSFVFEIKKENWNLFNPIEHKLFFNDQSIKYLGNKFSLSINELSFPYLETVYADVERDYQEMIELIRNSVENRDKNPAFWGNVIRIVYQNKQ